MRPAIALAALALAASAANGQPPPAPGGTLPPVTIQGNLDNAVGTSDAASQGVVTATLLQNRPTLRPAEILEFVPGVIVTQHSGDGKANQYFVRGFNLDHGTDFATWVDGMPGNMVSHAHGQGYTDLNWLVPELVERIDYRKGPYYADEGDFSSAGAAHFRLADTLPDRIASVTLGQRGFGRALLAGSAALTSGHLLYALESAHNDGPWRNPGKFHRTNGVLRYSVADGATRWSLTGMGSTAGWNSTDQVPRRAVDAGLLDRFGAIDPTDGGQTARHSLSGAWQRRVQGGEWKASAYAVRSRLNLFSDFTYFLDDAGGDQFEQAERRTLAGGALSRRWTTPLLGREGSTTVGVQLRQDRVAPVGLYGTVARSRSATIQESRVRETSWGLYAQNDTQWTAWLRSVAGVRADHFAFDVGSSIAQNSGRRSGGIASPKLSLVFGPWAATEYFLNAGYGFHSNDARGTVARLSPREALPVDPVTPLVRSRGAEIGVRTSIVPGLQSSLAFWQLALDSELVFSGDAGDTEPSRASRRHGIEWNNHYQATPWLLLDADLALSRARFTPDDPAGNAVPGAVNKVASLGATVTGRGPWSGHFQLRHVGPRPLLEDGSRRSASTTLASLRVGYRLAPQTRVALDIFNLFDRVASDIDYFYTSRLRGEPPGGVDDVHFHPAEPRSMRVSLSHRF